MIRRDLTLPELLRLRDHLRHKKLEGGDWALLAEVWEIMREELEATEERARDERESGATLDQLSRA